MCARCVPQLWLEDEARVLLVKRRGSASLPTGSARAWQLAPATWYAESTYSGRAYYNLANCVSRQQFRFDRIKSVKFLLLVEELYWKNYIRRSFPPPIFRWRIVIRKGRGEENTYIYKIHIYIYIEFRENFSPENLTRSSTNDVCTSVKLNSLLNRGSELFDGNGSFDEPWNSLELAIVGAWNLSSRLS